MSLFSKKEEAKPPTKPTIVFLFKNGMPCEVVTDTPDCARFIVVNSIPDGIDDDTSKVMKLTMHDGETLETRASVVLVGMRTPKHKGDTVIAQFSAAAGDEEHEIAGVEQITGHTDENGKFVRDDEVLREDGGIEMRVNSPIADFASIYKDTFGEMIDPFEMMKYMPRRGK